MPPKETDHLVPTPTPTHTPEEDSLSCDGRGPWALRVAGPSFNEAEAEPVKRSRWRWYLITGVLFGVFLVGTLSYRFLPASTESKTQRHVRTGPYELSELHKGHAFPGFYDFYEGADSIGSAGYNTYTPYERAVHLGLINVTVQDDGEEVFYIQSLPTAQGPRESIRMEGKTRFDAGLFILDVDHMPTGCGQWPAFWLTDEDTWPNGGEIDVVEGINYQAQAKTALHTSALCSQYAHVPSYKMTGHWDRATGIPDTYTGVMDFTTSVPADNCWVQASHQWANQGCVAISDQNKSLGTGLNDQGGGVYALQWDPYNRYIRSWVFPKELGIPSNLQDSMDAAASRRSSAVAPDPDTWGLPYGYFAIGEATGCSADHFRNMRIVINTAFCGTVAGNRFFSDCPKQAAQFNVSGDPVKSCNAWIASNPDDEMVEAYWKIRGVHVYERAWEAAAPKPNE
jgi:hypothetical protein